MSRRQEGTRGVWVLIATVGLVMALAGCGTPSGGWRQPGAMADKSDIATASDESDTRKRARIRLELATTYFTQGQYTTALDEVKQALAIDPSLTAGIELRALIYDAMGDASRADEAYKLALAKDAQNASVLHNYGWFLCRQQAYDKADALFEQAINVPMSVTSPQSWMARGVCQGKVGHWAEAERYLTRAYELEPANPAVAFNLATVLYRRGDFDRARFYARRVNNVPAQVNAESLWLAARIENRLGNVAGRDELGAQLRSRYPGSREATLFEVGRFDD